MESASLVESIQSADRIVAQSVETFGLAAIIFGAVLVIGAIRALRS